MAQDTMKDYCGFSGLRELMEDNSTVFKTIGLQKNVPGLIQQMYL